MVTDRASAVTYFADAKVVRQSIEQGVFVRAAKLGVVINSADGEAELPVGKLTAEIGAAALPLSAGKTWMFKGTVVVIENADVFWRYEVVLPNVDVAILSGGRMSDRLVTWLASPGMSDCQIIHWGDYDPVGVSEYLRLVRVCSQRIVPFAPPEIDELLPKYGKRSLIVDQVQYLDRLRNDLGNPYVCRMIRLFDVHRRGLEQELQLRHTVDAADRIRST